MVYIHEHLVDFLVNVGKYTVRPMDPMGVIHWWLWVGAIWERPG